MTEATPPGTEGGTRPTRAKERTARSVPPGGDRTHVTDAALATLIGLAAHEVPGVVGMAPTNLGEGLRRVLGVSQADEGVEIHRAGDAGDHADVVLHVVVAYGVNIPVVAESVVQRVQYAAKRYAGVTLRSVKVHVAGVSRG